MRSSMQAFLKVEALKVPGTYKNPRINGDDLNTSRTGLPLNPAVWVSDFLQKQDGSKKILRDLLCSFPQYRSKNTIILIIGIPKKGLTILGNPHSNFKRFQGLSFQASTLRKGLQGEAWTHMGSSQNYGPVSVPLIV